MVRQTEIIVVREADEMIAATFCFLTKAVDRREKRIAEIEDGFPGQSKAL
jgi:hypothetical protein